jgi:DNA-binding IclR family transcriptional regulator
VAAPIKDVNGIAIAAISTCVPLFRLDAVGVTTLAEAVTSAAREMSVLLGADAG